MDLRQLETFVSVAKLNSFSKAAQKLFITQPTVTNHIQNLEKELGTVLINRTGRNISLTKAGSILYKYALNIINACEMAKFDLATYKGKIQGHLELCSSSVPRKYVLPTILKKFIDRYPEVTFSLTDKDSKEVAESIIDGEYDFGIVGAKHSSKHLDYIELMEDTLVLIAPNNSRFNYENYSYLDKDVLFKEKLIFRETGSGTRKLVERKLHNNNINLDQLKIVSIIEDTETIKNLVALDVGLSFMSEKSVLDDIKLNKYKVFYIKDFDLTRQFYFVYHNKRHLSPLSQTFKIFMIDNIKNQTF